jgi:hypothetical protein
MSVSMISTLDDDLERLQNFSKEQILHYIDSKLSTLIISFSKIILNYTIPNLVKRYTAMIVGLKM